MPLVDGVVEGDVVPAVHNGENVAIKGKFFDDLANDVFDLKADVLEAYNQIGTLQNEVEGRALFIDLWQSVGGTYDDATGNFGLNGLTDITYDQALAIYNNGSIRYPYPNAFSTDIPTNIALPINNYILTKRKVDISCLFNKSKIKVIALLNENSSTILDAIRVSQFGRFAYDCQNLVRIIGTIDVSFLTTKSQSANPDAFYQCLNLEDLKLKGLGMDYSFYSCPKLSLESLSYMVDYAAPPSSGAMAITVHPDIYDKLTNSGGDEWYALMIKASGKNIDFETI